MLFQEEDEDGELRRSSYRKRTLSGTSRRSIVSNASTARPLTTASHPQAPSHSTPPSSRPRTPSIPSIPVSCTCRWNHEQKPQYHTVHHPPNARKYVHAQNFIAPVPADLSSTTAAAAKANETPAARDHRAHSLPSLVS